MISTKILMFFPTNNKDFCVDIVRNHRETVEQRHLEKHEGYNTYQYKD